MSIKTDPVYLREVLGSYVIWKSLPPSHSMPESDSFLDAGFMQSQFREQIFYFLLLLLLSQNVPLFLYFDNARIP